MKKFSTLTFICILIGLFASTKVKAQADQVYWVEGFDTLASAISTTAPGATADPYWASIGSGEWYMYGTYLTSGTSCSGYGANHLRMSKNITPDIPYFVTPVLSNGVGHVHFTRNQVARGYAIYWTADTGAVTSNGIATDWQLAYTTISNAGNHICTDTSVTINQPTAMRLKIAASKSNLNNDIDSIWVTSYSTIVPVKFTGITAGFTNGIVKVSWNNETELDLSRYEIERSFDGKNFSSIGTVKATNNRYYAWYDNSMVSGNIFYRIKGIDLNGKLSYSSIVNINAGSRLQDMVIAPNPVKGKTLSLHLNNLAKGNYTVNIFNNSGQKVFSNSIPHGGGNSVQTLTLPASVSKGIYNVHVTNGALNFNKTIIIE